MATTPLGLGLGQSSRGRGRRTTITLDDKAERLRRVLHTAAETFPIPPPLQKQPRGGVGSGFCVTIRVGVRVNVKASVRVGVEVGFRFGFEGKGVDAFSVLAPLAKNALDFGVRHECLVGFEGQARVVGDGKAQGGASHDPCDALVDAGLAGVEEEGEQAWMAEFEREEVWVFEVCGDLEVEFGGEGEEGCYEWWWWLGEGGVWVVVVVVVGVVFGVPWGFGVGLAFSLTIRFGCEAL